ncbi:hypothetical protein ACFSUK_25095 [Sphingobium scionense]
MGEHAQQRLWIAARQWHRGQAAGAVEIEGVTFAAELRLARPMAWVISRAVPPPAGMWMMSVGRAGSISDAVRSRSYWFARSATTPLPSGVKTGWL